MGPLRRRVRRVAPVGEGRLVHRQTVFEGIESCVDALNGLFTGANIGKMLVRISSG